MATRDTKSPTDLDRQIGFRIRARRIAITMSQVELGSMIGVTFQQVQKYENGSNRISVGRLQQVASALGTTIEVLIGVPADATIVIPHEPDTPSEEARGLIKAFASIGDRKLRRAMLNLVRHLASSKRV